MGATGPLLRWQYTIRLRPQSISAIRFRPDSCVSARPAVRPLHFIDGVSRRAVRNCASRQAMLLLWLVSAYLSPPLALPCAAC